TAIATSATASVTIGTAISDTATLSGATATATGNISFALYGPFTGAPSGDTCDAGHLVTTLGPVAIGSPNGSGNYVVGSGNYTPTQAGRYQWTASYTSRDGTNTDPAATCKSAGSLHDALPISTAIATSATASVTIGTAISDTATLSGATATATG